MSQTLPTIKTRCSNNKCRKTIDTGFLLLHKLRGSHTFKCPRCGTKFNYTLKIEKVINLKLKLTDD